MRAKDHQPLPHPERQEYDHMANVGKMVRARMKRSPQQYLESRGPGRRVVPAPRAMPERRGPVSPQFTIWFHGPGALPAYRACMKAMNPYPFNALQTGSHTKIAFDTDCASPRKRRK